ncbi:hypothetical protein DFH09DRAFT_1120294 [Mycena vulgaris]|nr:hypothetical protein DFH09DRAFT_1120294 [Mycena vulgaris]
MTINISVVDFPRCPIKEVSPENLLRHWKIRAGWSDTLSAAVESEMRAVELSQTTKGAVHCEAGLVASLLLRLRKPQDLNAAEPQILVDAFASVTECCPVCRMLIELLQTDPTNLKPVSSVGPPHWLPISVLHKLEKGLLQKIAEVVADRDDFKASRSSSTTKYDFSDDFPVTGNALLAGFPVD